MHGQTPQLYASVKRAGIGLVASVPDDWVVPLLQLIDADPDIIHVPVARESEIPAVCAGAWFGGTRAMAIMGIAGLLATGHEFTTLNMAHQIPLLVLASRRGTREDARTYQVGQGLVGVPYLDALRIPHETVEHVDDDLVASTYERALLLKSAYTVFATRSVLLGDGGS